MDRALLKSKALRESGMGSEAVDSVVTFERDLALLPAAEHDSGYGHAEGRGAGGDWEQQRG